HGRERPCRGDDRRRQERNDTDGERDGHHELVVIVLHRDSADFALVEQFFGLGHHRMTAVANLVAHRSALPRTSVSSNVTSPRDALTAAGSPAVRGTYG